MATPVELAVSGDPVTASNALPIQAVATENHIGEIGKSLDVIDVTLTLDTAIYTSGDVLSDTVTLTNAMRVTGGKGILHTITVIDEDDQGATIEFYFFKATQSLGTKNSAPNISDAAARDLLCHVSIDTSAYVDLGGVKVVTTYGLGMVLEAASDSRDIFVGTITRGTPTHSANGIKVKFGIERG